MDCLGCWVDCRFARGAEPRRHAATLGLLAPPQRFGDQRVGQNKLGLRHLLDRKQHVGGFARRWRHRGGCARHRPRRRAARPESLAAIDRGRHLDLHDMAGVALEIRAPHQRPVEARRRKLQPIGAIDRIGDVEHRRQRPRRGLAILDRHAAVRPLGHDLHGAAGGAGDAHAHQPIAEPFEHRLDKGGDAGRQAWLDDEASLGAWRGCYGLSHPFVSVLVTIGTCSIFLPRSGCSVPG